MKFLVFLISALGLLFLLFPIKPALAIVDPLSVPNNKFGIHIISGTDEEASETASLVNSSGGDWGYLTVLIEEKERKTDRWQIFFDDLRRRHLIPIVRIATQPVGSNWTLPYDKEEQAWADFLDSLNWPTKNRYVVIYNEPNQGHEWNGIIDPASYAQVLSKTIDALKSKNPDFFVLNAGFDASAPDQPPLYEDEEKYLEVMNQVVPGIFNKLDGWVSHSYPNPNFSGSPDDSGRGSVRTYQWEKEILKKLGVTKNLPVFITETGWKHAEGLKYDSSLLTSDQIAKFYQQAFEQVWNDPEVVAITPFLLNYQDYPFDHFSFKQITGEPQNKKILGISDPPFYQPFFTIQAIQKSQGSPIQDDGAELSDGSIYASLVIGEGYILPFQFKNIGESIWTKDSQIKLNATTDSDKLTINPVPLGEDQNIEPGQRVAFVVNIKGVDPGVYHLSLDLYKKDKTLLVQPLQFTTEIKSPVKIQVNETLKFKQDFSGDYILYFQNPKSQTVQAINLDAQGFSDILEEKTLLPDMDYQITLTRPFYKPKAVNLRLISGVNKLDFGELDPDFISAIPHPSEFWQLLPFSN